MSTAVASERVVSGTRAVRMGSPAAQATDPAALWTAARVQQGICSLLREALGTAAPTVADEQAVQAIVQLTLAPPIYPAVRRRQERDQAAILRDVATRYAFAGLRQRPCGELDALSQHLIHATIRQIYECAAEVTRRVGEDPLDVDPRLWPYLCQSIAEYVPRKPLCAHIMWQLQHYESAALRAMRQLKTLLTHPRITTAFRDYVLDAPAPDALKAQLLQMARGGGLHGVDYRAVIHFFAEPATVAFVKRFAATVQTAYTLYERAEYHDVVWQGRKLRADVRWGYLEAALAQLRPADEASLDEETFDLHSLVGETPDAAQWDYWHRELFEVWVARCAHEYRPDDPVWQAAYWRYVDHQAQESLVAQGLTNAETWAAAQARVEALRADHDVWQWWMQSTF